jgi:hypothetical protein
MNHRSASTGIFRYEPHDYSHLTETASYRGGGCSYQRNASRFLAKHQTNSAERTRPTLEIQRTIAPRLDWRAREDSNFQPSDP